MAQLDGLHPFPSGWFAIAFSNELAAGEVKTVHYFGKDIVLYRTAAGEAVAVEPFCPHLGAHLGHGGKVEGESIRCPFHGWRFASDGPVVEVPGCDKLPKRAALKRWPICEQDDVICVFHDVEVREGRRAEPEPFRFPPLGSDGFTPPRTVEWTLRTHPQEICENTVDMAHLAPIHGVVGAHVIDKPKVDGTHMNVVLEFMAPGDLVGMPGQDNHVQLDVIVDGIGRIVSRTHVKNVGVRARQAIYCTPIDGERMSLRGVVSTMATEDAAFTASLAELFFSSFVHDFKKDFVIWENKRYVERPTLSGADGPIGVYRRWTRQFYPRHPRNERDEAAKPDTPAEGLLSKWKQRVDRVIDRGRALLDTRAPDEPQRAPPNGRYETETPATKIASVHSVDHYFETLPDRFRPDGSRGVDAVFQWKLSGSGGAARYAVVRDGNMSLHDGEHHEPTVTICMSADDYVQMVNGQLDGALAFTSGRAKLEGSLAMAVKMRKIFPA